jgi:hypothetical protein
MTQVLKLPEFVDQYRVSEMQVGRSGVKTGLYPQRPAPLQFLDQILIQQYFADPSTDNLHRFGG